MSHTKLLTIRVTEEQKLAIEHFFIFHNWDFEIVEERSEIQEQSTAVITETESSEQEVPAPQENTVSGNDVDTRDHDDGNNRDPVAPGPSGDNNGCVHCFSSPCVTTVTQKWFGRPQLARPGNNLIRKQKYKLFWKMLSDRGLWKYDRYVRRKMRLLAMDDPEHTIVYTLREVIPDCVLEFVRGMYPNPQGIPYMGHMWQ